MREPEKAAFFQDDAALPYRMQRLIFGRLALIFLLLLASWWWTNSFLEIPISHFPTGLFLFCLFSIGLTAIYHAASYFNRNFIWQVRVQLFIDILLITWIVWETGDVMSPYVTLYIVLICVTGFLLGKAETLVVAGSSAVFFTVLSILAGQDIINSISGESRPPRIVQIVGLNDIAILLVGLIAARISERKRISEQLRQSEESFADLHLLHERIIQSIASGLITTDLEGKIYGFNRGAERISGLSAEDAIGRSLLTIFGEDIRKPVDICLGAVQTAEFSTEHFEARLSTAQGTEATVACSVTPLFSRIGAVSGMIVIFQDISQIRALEESLRRSDRLAAVGRMAAGLAHEIRNPLGSLSSSLQFLRESVPPETDAETLMDVVLRESERLNGIITNFLSYARPPADGLQSQTFVPTDIDAAIRDCLILLRHNPEVKDSHRFTYDAPKVPVKTQVSETQIKQVFWNLLQNSIHAMPDGGNVVVKLNQLPGKRVQIVFQDTGPGISEDNLQHLFEPFSIAASGTGLGLSIVHKIVNDNGGRIDVGTVNGEGTQITVELPR